MLGLEQGPRDAARPGRSARGREGPWRPRRPSLSERDLRAVGVGSGHSPSVDFRAVRPRPVKEPIVPTFALLDRPSRPVSPSSARPARLRGARSGPRGPGREGPRPPRGLSAATGIKGQARRVAPGPELRQRGARRDAVLLVGVGEGRGCRLGRLSSGHRPGRRAARPARPRRHHAATDRGGRLEDAPGDRRGLLLGSYRFDRYKSTRTVPPAGGEGDGPRRPGPTRAPRRRPSAGRGDRRVPGMGARPREHPGDRSPARGARASEAQAMAKRVGLRCKVWAEAELKKGGFGGILGVGQGSVNPPRLIELWYEGGGPARRSRSPARASRSTPAGCRSRTPRGWSG